jgi:alpha-1,3-rhamnosyltransferase
MSINFEENQLLIESGVSVVVPSYNHAPFVEKCLLSIMEQTHAPAELIVIDDGSSDDSPKIIERALRDCPFPCELIVRSNRGLCATLNEGLKRSRGRYFTYLGSDDIWLPESLRERVHLLESRPEAVLSYGHFYVVDAQDRIVGSTLDWQVGYTDGPALKMLLVPFLPQSSTVLYRREAVERYGWNEKARLEDYELFLRLSADGEFALVPRVLSGWRHHGSNTSRNAAFMMNEFLAAQWQVADSLGISARELQVSQSAIKFNSGGEFLLAGQRGKAMLLTLQNLRGASSSGAVARRVLRLLLPLSVLRWRDRRIRQTNSIQYGSIRI